jgi:hypothetical protein
MHGVTRTSSRLFERGTPQYDRLLNDVGCRLYADTGDDQQHESMLRDHALDLAKQDARHGNFTRLKKLYPELADVLERLKPRPGKRVRRNPGRLYSQFGKQVHADTIKDIRRILEELTGQKRVNAKLVVQIAADVIKCSPSEIAEIIKRGSRYSRAIRAAAIKVSIIKRSRKSS